MTPSISFRTSIILVFALQAFVVLAVTAFTLSERAVSNERVLEQMQNFNARVAMAAQKRGAAGDKPMAAGVSKVEYAQRPPAMVLAWR